MYKVTYQVGDDRPIFLSNVSIVKETDTHYTFKSGKDNRIFTISKDVVKTLIEVKER